MELRTERVNLCLFVWTTDLNIYGIFFSYYKWPMKISKEMSASQLREYVSSCWYQAFSMASLCSHKAKSDAFANACWWNEQNLSQIGTAYHLIHYQFCATPV
jgi:hypothetical protein